MRRVIITVTDTPKGRASAVDGTRLAVTAETTTVRQDDANVLPQLNFLNGTSVGSTDSPVTHIHRYPYTLTSLLHLEP
jgi:hypothetical protein